MDILESNKCNLFALQLIADYYQVDFSLLNSYYQELQNDSKFLDELNVMIDSVKKVYSKGLFGKGIIDSVDWFGNQRITMYVLIRLLKPEIAVETGVFYGGTTVFILNALAKNKKGRLISMDLPANSIDTSKIHRHSNVGDSELLPNGIRPGFIIPEYLKPQWEFIEGESLSSIENLKEPFTFFSHDSEHSREYMLKELNRAKTKMLPNGTLMADDIDWSNGFMEFCVSNKLYPLFLTDNGKSNLKVRLGLVRLDHPNNGKKDVTG